MSSYGKPSNTTNYSPFASDMLLDSLERCGIYAPENKHLYSGRRSFNLLLASDWSNRGINLFTMTELVIPLIPGVIEYFLNQNTVSVYDTFRRQYQMNEPANYAVSFTTQSGSPNVTVAIPDQTAPVGSYVGIAIPISVGGLILYGFYQVIGTPTANSFTIGAGANATAPVTDGGQVPLFTTTSNSQSVNVNLPNHGYVAGVSFPVNVATTVGGITLSGNYVVQTIVDANNFTILASSNALSGASASENGGQASISTQDIVAGYTDILMTPYSRTDYASQADKTATGAPTVYWVNKQKIPVVSVWPVTDNTGPYELHMWVQQQIQDVNPTGGQTLDMVQRMFYACTLDLARDLAMKFAPATYATLKQEATEAWQRAEGSDVENTSTFILPQMPTGY
jgi:hypothetical protein